MSETEFVYGEGKKETCASHIGIATAPENDVTSTRGNHDPKKKERVPFAREKIALRRSNRLVLK